MLSGPYVRLLISKARSRGDAASCSFPLRHSTWARFDMDLVVCGCSSASNFRRRASTSLSVASAATNCSNPRCANAILFKHRRSCGLSKSSDLVLANISRAICRTPLKSPVKHRHSIVQFVAASSYSKPSPGWNPAVWRVYSINVTHFLTMVSAL